ncbi:energy transducer TonB [Chitinolyticbacter meiyuanensis]|uniref:energy transducer TonB n=1 Tax=Chitinolyticbacter meiyuanensis TaxID=682798 RepID=UPI0011E5E6AA|nr:energy transducer TonB [Chitinolyticbacter meiyuanensis]
MSPRLQLQAREAHQGLSFALAIVVHLLFGAFLLISVQWQTKKPEPVVVELWGPPPAAPSEAREVPKSEPVRPEPPRPPQPEVKQPDIATERIKPKPTPAKVTPTPAPTPTPLPKATPTPKPAPTPAAKPTQQPTQPPKPKPTKKPSEMDQLLGTDALIKPDAKPQPGGKAGGQGSNPDAPAGSTGRGSSANGADLANYKGRVIDLIRSRTVFDDNTAGNPTAVYKISLLPSGEIQSAMLVRSSGDAAYNEATHRAIMALGQFPPLPSNKPFTGGEREWTITFRLRD